MPLLTRTAAAALAVVYLACAQVPSAARGAEAHGRPELRRAEQIIDALRRLDAAARDPRAYSSAHEKLYPGLHAAADSLSAGDLRTDLSTAVALHDAARRAAAGGPPPDCDAELRPAYRKLCREESGGGRASLLRAKARLHLDWAEASVDYARGRRDAQTTRALLELRAERALDLALASRAVELLQALERDVNAYPSLAEYEEKRAAAGAAPARLEASFAEALGALERLLAALPRGGPVYAPLRNARNSYRDGLFWHRLTRGLAARVVTADALADTDTLDAARLDPSAAGYTVVLNWRNARRYTARARALLGASMVGAVASHP